MLELLAAAAIAACAIPVDLTPAPARPQEETRIVAVERLVLAYYWWPQECRREDLAETSGCRAASGLRVHGLWPDGAGTSYPQFCRAPTPLRASEVRRNYCMTPSPSLLQHEWAKHGTCHWPNARTYFAAARRIAKTIGMPDRVGVTSAGAVRDAIVTANPRLPRASLFVGTDRNQWLTEVRVCLKLNEMPAPCPPGGTGAADVVPVQVWQAPPLGSTQSR